MSDSELEEESSLSTGTCVTEEFEITSDPCFNVEEKLQEGLLGRVQHHFDEFFKGLQKGGMVNCFPGYGGYGSMLACCTADIKPSKMFFESADPNETRPSPGANEHDGKHIGRNGSLGAAAERVVHGTGNEGVRTEKLGNVSGNGYEKAEIVHGTGNGSVKTEKLGNGSGSECEEAENPSNESINEMAEKPKSTNEETEKLYEGSTSAIETEEKLYEREDSNANKEKISRGSASVIADANTEAFFEHHNVKIKGNSEPKKVLRSKATVLRPEILNGLVDNVPNPGLKRKYSDFIQLTSDD